MAEQQISVSRDANGNIIVSGDGNIIIVPQVMPRIEEHEEEGHPVGPDPYMGLSAFHEEDEARFFGRTRLTKELWDKYRDIHEPVPYGQQPLRFLAILGPSGSGKSSVARAGLIPELARRPLPAMPGTRVAALVPGSHPLEALATILARIATNDPAPVAKTREFMDELKQCNSRHQCDGLRRIADALPQSHELALMILVDQFEELYSLCQDAEEQKAFTDNLLHAARENVSVVITLRSDFLSYTQSHPELSHAIAQSGNHVIVPATDSAELR